MRTLHKSLAYLGVLVCAAMGQFAACASYSSDCSENGICLRNGDEYRGGGQVSPECKALPSEDSSVIKDECGIFVSSSAADGGDGTKAKPFKSLQAGLDAAKSAKFRVYACAETYAEEAKADSVSLFGGFDCANGWAYVVDSAKRAIIAPKDGVPLRVSGGGDLLVQDIVARAPDYSGLPPDAMQPAKSSIAVFANEATVDFSRCNMEGNNAQGGAEGETPLDDPDTLNGSSGNPGKGICEAGADNPGGAAMTKMCPDGSTSVGGEGGDGGTVQTSPSFMAFAGGDGADGAPAGSAGQKGVGEFESGAWSCANDGNGTPGQSGDKGGPGAGATAGKIDATGYVPTSGMAGEYGKPGQGGGGGGGARGAQGVCGGTTRAGASGGSGGTGGCGGRGGGGGFGGGASIALLSYNASVVLSDCVLKSAAGGSGGTGGDGQTGGGGGTGASGGLKSGSSNSACAGGAGGEGGNGGPGGGGAGGPSVGIAHVGKAPEKRGSTMITPGTPGNGGLGGGIMSNAGANGTTGELVAF
ncbi:hypothetical protein [Polyangium jinanense]|nr:hypothetical protein [Polyangium jinanense]MDC3957288.1 hypothetical protein [Polyangium jinanense]